MRRIDFGERHFLEPIAVENGPRPLRIEHLEGLCAVAFGVGQHLFVGELRAGGGATARVADHGGEIADDEDRFVAEVLELTQLSQHERVAEVEVGAGRIDSELDSERPA